MTSLIRYARDAESRMALNMALVHGADERRAERSSRGGSPPPPAPSWAQSHAVVGAIAASGAVVGAARALALVAAAFLWGAVVGAFLWGRPRGLPRACGRARRLGRRS
jgi:hypothetical protein